MLNARRTILLMLILLLSALSSQTIQVRSASELAATKKVYLPLVMRPKPVERYIGIAFEQSSLPRYLANVQAFQQATGVHVAILHTPAVWHGMEFRDLRTLLDFARMNDSTPLLIWEPWVGMHAGVGPTQCQTTYSLQNILNGQFDAYLHRFAQGAADWGHGMFMDFGHEMNVNQAAWSGACNGGANGGPQKFVQAYRYIHDIFVQHGATNVKWVWTPNSGSFPAEPWNAANNYYPGDAYVDWIGSNAYNWGNSSPYDRGTFNHIVGAMLDQMAVLHPNKPQMIIESASVDKDGYSRPAWITDALASVAQRPLVRAYVYASYTAENYLGSGRTYDFNILNDPASLQAFGNGTKQYGFAQYLYDAVSATPVPRPTGTGASRAVSLLNPLKATEFDTLTTRKHPIVVFTGDWNSKWDEFRSILFEPMSRDGQIPLFKWNSFGISPGEIYNGSHDSYIRSWARGARTWGKPLWLSWGVEPNHNLSGLPWTGLRNGGPNGGTAAYIRAWRHIHNIFTQEQATNVKWVWMPYNEDTMDPAYYSKFPVWSRPDSAWNAFYNYYPGNNYVDWIATTNINSGDDSFGGFWKPLPMFVDYVMSNAQKRFPSKPQMVIMASVEDPSNRNRKAAWITQAYQELKKYPRVRAVAWQQEGDSRWDVNSSTTSLQAYKTAVADPYYKSTPPAP